MISVWPCVPTVIDPVLFVSVHIVVVDYCKLLLVDGIAMNADKTLPRSIFLFVLVLVLSLSTPMIAGAEGVSDGTAQEPVAETPIVIEASAGDEADDQESLQDAEVLPEEADSDPAPVVERDAEAEAETTADEATSADEPVIDNADNASEPSVSTISYEDVIELLYIDAGSIEVGGVQYIVVSLQDLPAEADASLVVETPGGVTLSLVPEATTDKSMLFSIVAAEEGEYRIDSLVLSQGTLVVSFEGCEAVSFASANAQPYAEPEIETQVMTTDESGAVITTDSIEEALTEAGAEVPDLDGTGVAISSFLAPMMRSVLRQAAATTHVEHDWPLVVYIDPGHGTGYDAGAVGVGGITNSESVLTWKIANYCMAELQLYANVEVHLTTTLGESPKIRERITRADQGGADVVVSIHLNATTGGSTGVGRGAEVWYPALPDDEDAIEIDGRLLSQSILDELTALGLRNRGVKASQNPGYMVCNYSRAAGFPGIIVEHCFIDNVGDYSQFLSDESKLKALGVADATGIANFYGLKKASEKDFADVYDYNYYISHYSDVPRTTRAAAFQHFLTTGMYEGRQACAGFDPKSYYNEYADLRAQYGTGWAGYYLHYINGGKADGRHGTGCSTLKECSETQTMYRLYNPNSGEHFYTASAKERDNVVAAGWNYEGVGWTAPKWSGTPVYRLYNANAGEHHYTTDIRERENLVAAGWKYEGIGWYSSDLKSVPLYRQYNPNAYACNHNYTTSRSENDNLVRLGWRAEGIGWYGVGTASGTPILGSPTVSKSVLVNNLTSGIAARGGSYPSSTYSSRGASTAQAFINVLWNAAVSEGVRPEVLYAQVVLETNYLQFGGDVSAEQCNFGGLGAVGGGEPGCAFSSVSEGLTAQAQHLRAYTGNAPLTTLVDPRYGAWLFGKATTVEGLTGTWAMDPTYSNSLLTIMKAVGATIG